MNNDWIYSFRARQKRIKENTEALCRKHNIPMEAPEETSWELAGDNPQFPQTTDTESVYPEQEETIARRPTYLDELAGMSD